MNHAESGQLHLVCPQCLATNRVPEQRLAEGPVCGQCRTRLLPDVPVALDGDAFERYVAGSDKSLVSRAPCGRRSWSNGSTRRWLAPVVAIDLQGLPPG